MTGTSIITELIQELKNSVEASKEFEGEMARLSDYARSEACVPPHSLLLPGFGKGLSI